MHDQRPKRLLIYLKKIESSLDQPIHHPESLQPELTLLAERRKPSGECLINATTPEGSRPAAKKTQSKASAVWC